jgi:bifunctional non-homologous end joining protein LigD
MSRLAEPIRFSETIPASAAELIRAVREQGLEGVIAKRRGSSYQPGRRSGAWLRCGLTKDRSWSSAAMCLHRRTSTRLWSVGYYEGKKLIYLARVRNGFTPASREALFK